MCLGGWIACGGGGGEMGGGVEGHPPNAIHHERKVPRRISFLARTRNGFAQTYYEHFFLCDDGLQGFHDTTLCLLYRLLGLYSSIQGYNATKLT